MSKRQILMILGVWTIIFLFLGFPASWDKIFAVIVGVLIVGVSYSMAPRMRLPENRDMPFMEHRTTDIIKPTTRDDK